MLLYFIYSSDSKSSSSLSTRMGCENRQNDIHTYMNNMENMFELLFSIYARSFIILCVSFLLMTYSIHYASTRTVLLHGILPPFVLPPTPRHHHIHTGWWWSFSTPYISFHFIILYHQFLEEIVRIRVRVCSGDVRWMEEHQEQMISESSFFILHSFLCFSIYTWCSRSCRFAI